jgi:hypothetical protein
MGGIDLTSSQERTLQSAVRRLERDFGDRTDRETIERSIADAYARLSATARIHTHVPALAERQARARLSASLGVRSPAPRDVRPRVSGRRAAPRSAG